MKITYERLNQIIEEEVVKFKRLNEDYSATTADTTSLPQDAAGLKGSITQLLNTKLETIKDNVSQLQEFYKKLKGL